MKHKIYKYTLTNVHITFTYVSYLKISSKSTVTYSWAFTDKTNSHEQILKHPLTQKRVNVKTSHPNL